MSRKSNKLRVLRMYNVKKVEKVKNAFVFFYKSTFIIWLVMQTITTRVALILHFSKLYHFPHRQKILYFDLTVPCDEPHKKIHEL